MKHRHPRHHHGRNRFGSEGRAGGSGGGFSGRSRRGKLFDSAQFQLVLLKLIADRDRHGYELMREIEERTGGNYAPSPGVVYPTLTLLVEMELIAEADTPGTRKTFTITEAGRAKLAKHTEQAEHLLSRLDSLGHASSHVDATPVRRAMGNLREVLMTRLARSETTNEQVLEAARIIDEAAGRIERLQ